MYIMNGAVVIYNCLVLYKLLRGSQPVVVCPARGIEKMRIPRDWHLALKEGQPLVLSPFSSTQPRPRVEPASQRNDLVAGFARRILIAHAAPGGKTEAFARRLIDCIIASAAIRAGAPVLHNDANFQALARHTELRTYEAERG